MPQSKVEVLIEILSNFSILVLEYLQKVFITRRIHQFFLFRLLFVFVWYDLLTVLELSYE